jgi:hypothetical protein
VKHTSLTRVLPCRYAHYDNNPSFSDFTAFGGWKSPAMKQYIGDGTSCGVGVDYDWYPSSTFYEEMVLNATRIQKTFME